MRGEAGACSRRTTRDGKRRASAVRPVGSLTRESSMCLTPRIQSATATMRRTPSENLLARDHDWCAGLLNWSWSRDRAGTPPGAGGPSGRARFCRHVRATSTVQPGHRWVYGVRAVCTSAAAPPGRVGPVAAGAHMLHDLMKRIRPGFAAVVRAREQPKDPRQGGVAAGPSVEPPVRCGDRVGHRLVQSVGVLSTSARQPCSRSCRTASPCRACSRRRTSCAGRASRQP